MTSHPKEKRQSNWTRDDVVQALELCLSNLKSTAGGSSMAEEQRVTNIRQTLLAALPLLTEAEKAAYLIEQLLPVVEKAHAEKAGLDFGAIVSAGRFSEFASDYFTAEPEVKDFMDSAKNPNQRLLGAMRNFTVAEKRLKSKRTVSTLLIVSAAGIALGLMFLVLFFFPELVLPAVLISAAASYLIYRLVRKRGSIGRADEISVLSSDLSALESHVERERLALAVWSRNHAHAWNRIKKKLVDSYFASSCGKKLMRMNISDMLTSSWMACVKAEQSFLPPSARPSDEQWRSALRPKVEPEAELARQRQANLKNILLSRLTPDYYNGTYHLADVEVPFAELNLERPDASPGGEPRPNTVEARDREHAEKVKATDDAPAFPEEERRNAWDHIATFSN